MNPYVLLCLLGYAEPTLPAAVQLPIALTERFDSIEPYRVDLKVTISGRLALPTEKGNPPNVMDLNGASSLIYDERVLPSDDPRTGKVIRAYRDVSFSRTVAGREQKADIREAVRRMVVLRSERGKKVPFSPDGALTWGEIDVVRTDLYSPVLVTGLLPRKPVRPGDRWPATADAVMDLADFEVIEEGGLTVEFVSTVSINNRRFAKLVVAGVVKGHTEDGPSRQRLDGIAYFDLDADRMTYLNLKGTHELFAADGKTVSGRIDGTLVMSRGPAGRVTDLSDSALRGRGLTPNAENTLLLYDNPELGVRFHYPRRWRVGTVQGKQLTIEESRGGGILLTVDSPTTLPTADQFLVESRDYLRRQKWTLSGTEPVRRVAERPTRLDRFALDAEVNRERVRMEYAVLTQPEGGVTVAARLPWNERSELVKDVERILSTLAVTKRIEK